MIIPIIKSSFSQFRQDERGVTTIIYAILTPVLIGMIAFSVEMGHFRQRNASIQTSADMAAISGVLEYNINQKRRKARLAARGEAVENGFQRQDGYIAVELPIQSGPHAGKEGMIVTITQKQERYFSQIFKTKKNIVHKVSATVLVTGPQVCSLSLDPWAVGATTITGSADVDFDGCAMHSNSQANPSFSMGGSGTLTADCASASGGFNTSSGLTLTGCSGAQANRPQIPDPYGHIEAPDLSTMPAVTPATSAGKFVLSPGVISAPQINVNKPLVLTQPGVYVFDGTNISFKNNGSMSGAGVTIILMNGAQLSNTNGGAMDLTASKTGPYAGVLIYSDRDTSDPNQMVRINGNQQARLEGALYFPVQQVDFRGGGDLVSECTQIVARTIEFSGNSGLVNRNCPEAGVAPIFGAGVGAILVQ